MSAPAQLPPAAQPAALLAALRSGAGGSVEGAHAGDLLAAPPVGELPPARALAVIAAWTGSCLHAGSGAGALLADDPDLALLVGDWCFAHALQALAQAGDLPAIGALAQAIGECALVLAEPGGAELLAPIWAATCDRLGTL